MNIYLGKHFEELIRKQVETGRYANASEVVREALRRYEINEIKIENLRAKIDEGLASIEQGDVIVIDDIDAYLEEKLNRAIERAEAKKQVDVHAASKA
jgi:antitoxin ParD1/3/4